MLKGGALGCGASHYSENEAQAGTGEARPIGRGRSARLWARPSVECAIPARLRVKVSRGQQLLTGSHGRWVEQPGY